MVHPRSVDWFLATPLSTAARGHRTHNVGFSYELKYPGGGDVGTFVMDLSDWNVGDTFRAHGNRQFRISTQAEN
jgi:hypothetical protein